MPKYRDTLTGQVISSNSELSDDELARIADQNAHPVKAFAEGTGLPGILSLAGKGLKAQANLFSDPKQMIDLWKGVSSGIGNELSSIPGRVSKFSDLMNKEPDITGKVLRGAQAAGSAIPFIGKSFETGDEAIPASGEINKGPLAELLGNLTGNVAGLKSPEIAGGLSRILKRGAIKSYKGLFNASPGSYDEGVIKDMAPRLVEEGPYPKTFNRDKAGSIFDQAKGDANTKLDSIINAEDVKGTKVNISPAIQNVVKEGGQGIAGNTVLDSPLVSRTNDVTEKLKEFYKNHQPEMVTLHRNSENPSRFFTSEGSAMAGDGNPESLQFRKDVLNKAFPPSEGSMGTEYNIPEVVQALLGKEGASAVPFSTFQKAKKIAGNEAYRAASESRMSLGKGTLAPDARAWLAANRGLDEVGDFTAGPEYTNTNQRITDLIHASDLAKAGPIEPKNALYILRRALYPVMTGAGAFTASHSLPIALGATAGMAGLEALTKSPMFSSLSAQSKLGLSRLLQSGRSNPELMRAMLSGSQEAGREQ